MMSIFSHSCLPFVCLLLRNVYLDLPPIFCLGCLLSWCWAAWTVCIFWRLIHCWLLCLQIFHCHVTYWILYWKWKAQWLYGYGLVFKCVSCSPSWSFGWLGSCNSSHRCCPEWEKVILCVTFKMWSTASPEYVLFHIIVKSIHH